MPDSTPASSPPSSTDSRPTRRGVLSALGAAGAALTAGCAGLGGGGGDRNDPADGPGFADGEERVLHPTEIAAQGRDSLMTERGIHLMNNHGAAHTMSVRVARDGSQLFAGEYTLDEQDEVELDDIFVTQGEYTVTVGLDGDEEKVLDAVIDPEHLGVRASVFESGTFDVWQALCDTNACP